MTQPSPPSHASPLVAELCEAAELEPPAQELAIPARGARDFVQALHDGGHRVDALRFLAHLLPRREAIWWAWTCARRVTDEGAKPEARAALDATERWIQQPTDENRRAAMAAAEAATFETPAGCTALAVFLSGGSLAPPTAPAVDPPRFAAAKAISGSLLISGIASEPEKAEEKYDGFLSYGLQLADRIRLWDAVERGSA
jgi:hypothetical protein